jgi:hypothetical protein
VAAGLAAWRAPRAYYGLVQEDGPVEWVTFWSLLLAGVLHVRRRSAWRRGLRRAWFPVLIALACWFVALEEVSWGQRVIGYRPPPYFLAHNTQQEVNVHNLLGSDLRQVAVTAAIVGYGVALPLVAARRRLRGRLVRLGVVPPPLELAPLFVVAAVVQVAVPVRFAGEWSELLTGLGLLVAPVLRGLRAPRPGRAPAVVRTGAAVALVTALGLAATTWARHLRAASPEAVAEARVELASLAADLARVRLPDAPGRHQRLYTIGRQERWSILLGGRFVALVDAGLPEDRARFLLDPWDGPYWLRYERLGDGTCRALLYSFGPNRLRDSAGFELAGDDLGVEPELRCAESE